MLPGAKGKIPEEDFSALKADEFICIVVLEDELKPKASLSFFSCVLASLKEGVSVRRSIRPSVTRELEVCVTVDFQARL